MPVEARRKNGELLVSAFDICYSKAEVYRRTHIEKVFGPIDRMDTVGLFSYDPHVDTRAVVAVANDGGATGIRHAVQPARDT